MERGVDSNQRPDGLEEFPENFDSLLKESRREQAVATEPVPTEKAPSSSEVLMKRLLPAERKAAPADATDSPPAATEESEETAEEEEKPEIKLETAPGDYRFPTTNQSRHCFTRYLCVAAKGEDASECDKFAKYYRSLCPGEWINGTSKEKTAHSLALYRFQFTTRYIEKRNLNYQLNKAFGSLFLLSRVEKLGKIAVLPNLVNKTSTDRSAFPKPRRLLAKQEEHRSRTLSGGTV
ncbi:cytochrome c oxidase subunit 6B-1-like protein [Tanacetum coccineum]